MDWETVLERYRAVALVNENAGSWFIQRQHGDPFACIHHRMSPRDLRGMLMGNYWIACYAPPSGQTDRIEIDLDGTAEEPAAERSARYQAIREVFGSAWTPLVYATPSGHGLRMVYRIEMTALADLTTTVGRGPIADVLRSVGLEVRSGVLEVYPQKRQANRLPLGSGMRILDTVTLQPLAGVGADAGAEDELLAALRYLEAWHAAPCTGLVAQLRARADALPAGSAPASRRVDRGSGPVEYGMPSATRGLLRMGLQGPRSRYDAEWKVGLALAAQPERYPEYGLGMHAASDEQIARALATWLADRHNGYSNEWRRAAGAGRAGAIEHFTRRYLACGPGGDHMVNRLRRALLSASARAGGREITLAEREQAMSLSSRFGAGARRYRFEVWTCACFRAIQSIVRYHASLGSDLAPAEHPSGGHSVVVPIAASWMEDWRYGGGGGKGGQPMRYAEYRAALAEARVLVRERPYVYHGRRYRDKDIIPGGEATGYRAPYPVDGPTAVGIPWATIVAACRTAGSGENQITPDEAYHVLYLAAQAESGLDLKARYGRRTAEHVRYAAGILRRATENSALSGSDSALEITATGFSNYQKAG